MGVQHKSAFAILLLLLGSTPFILASVPAVIGDELSLHSSASRDLSEASADIESLDPENAAAASAVGTDKKPRRYKLEVTIGNRSPDCVNRKVILINGRFQPRLVLTQGDWVEVSSRVTATTCWDVSLMHCCERIHLLHRGLKLNKGVNSRAQPQ